jgi:hypothetical protein
MGFDVKCWELAKELLGDDWTEGAWNDLAQKIQNAYEDWLNEAENTPASPKEATE